MEPSSNPHHSCSEPESSEQLQLTMGDVLAMTRWAKEMATAGVAVALDDAVRYIERYKPCAVCGYSEVMHMGIAVTLDGSKPCTRYAQAMHREQSR